MSTTPVFPIVPPYMPELLAEVQARIEAFIGEARRSLPPAAGYAPAVLEFGSGWSTIWFGLLGCAITSFEHDPDWFAEVFRVLEEQQAAGLCHRFARVQLAQPYIFPPSPWKGHTYDLVYVDCVDECRVPCVEVSMGLLRSGGMFVLDDSHWEILKPAREMLSIWPSETISGQHARKTGEVCFHQTTIYRRLM